MQGYSGSYPAAFSAGHLLAALAAVLLGALHSPTAAAAKAALTLPEAQRLAIVRSRQLVAQDSAVTAAREMAVAARQLPDPVATLGVNNLPINGPDAWSLTRDFMTMTSVGVMQEFTRAEKREARTERYEREADKSRAERDDDALGSGGEDGAWLFDVRRFVRLHPVRRRHRPVLGALARARVSEPGAVTTPGAGVSLPLRVLMAFIVMYYQGVNANIMSLGGIAIAIGAMVDAAVVMIENAHKLAMTVVVIIAGLLPIIWGSGTGSEVMRRIAAPMVGGMITAPLLSMFVVPAAYLLIRWRAQRRARIARHAIEPRTTYGAAGG